MMQHDYYEALTYILGTALNEASLFFKNTTCLICVAAFLVDPLLQRIPAFVTFNKGGLSWNRARKNRCGDIIMGLHCDTLFLSYTATTADRQMELRAENKQQTTEDRLVHLKVRAVDKLRCRTSFSGTPTRPHLRVQKHAVVVQQAVHQVQANIWVIAVYNHRVHRVYVEWDEEPF